MLEIGAQMNIVQDPQMREQLFSFRHLRNTQGHDFVSQELGMHLLVGNLIQKKLNQLKKVTKLAKNYKFRNLQAQRELQKV